MISFARKEQVGQIQHAVLVVHREHGIDIHTSPPADGCCPRSACRCPATQSRRVVAACPSQHHTQAWCLISRFVREVNVERGLSEQVGQIVSRDGWRQSEGEKLSDFAGSSIRRLSRFYATWCKPEGSTPHPVNCLYERCPALCGRFLNSSGTAASPRRRSVLALPQVC